MVAISGQLLVLLDRFFGSFLPPEPLSALYYASLPVLFPIGILIYPLGYSIFPKLSRGLTERKDEGAAELLCKALGWINFVLIPMTVIFIFAPQEVIRLVFERGAFGEVSTDLSARCLRIFAFSLLASGYVFVLSRVYLAAGLGKRLAVFCLAAFLFKALAAYPGIKIWGLEGLAGAGSAALVGLALLQLRGRPSAIHFSAGRRLGPECFRLTIAALLAFGLAWLGGLLLADTGSLVHGAILFFLFGFLYLTLCFIFHIPELSDSINLIRRLGGKLPYGAIATRL